jgi:hypothetical protein
LKRIVNLFNLKHFGLSGHFTEVSSVSLEILKEAPQLSSLSIDLITLKSFLHDSELCKYLNQMIKRLNIQCLSIEIFNNYPIEEQLCKVFSNIEHLECNFFKNNNLLLLLNHLPKLSTVKATFGTEFEFENLFSQFKNEERKRNAIFDIKRMSETLYKYPGYKYDEGQTFYYTEIFIWIGKNMT